MILINSKANDVGNKFGRLTVTSVSSNYHKTTNRKYKFYDCICDCGTSKTIRANHIRSGATISCGCYNKEIITKHGLGGTSVYNIWKNMMSRCYNPNDKAFVNYGARGIYVCNEWHDITVFNSWLLNNDYHCALTLDRINNNGNYEPSNCKLSTRTEQCNNKRGNRFITYDGQTLTIAEWSRITGIHRNTIYQRLKRGKSIADTLNPNSGYKLRLNAT